MHFRRKGVQRKVTIAIHYENTPVQVYCEFYHQNNENFQMKKIW